MKVKLSEIYRGRIEVIFMPIILGLLILAVLGCGIYFAIATSPILLIFFILLVALLGIVLLFYVKKHVLPIVKVVASFGEKKLVKIDESFRSGFYNYHIRHHLPVLVKEVDTDREMELYCPVYFLLSISTEDKELPVYCVDNIAVFLKEDVKMLRGESK